MILAAIAIVIVIATAALFYFLWRSRRRRRLYDTFDLKLLLIRLPARQPEEGKDFKDEINLSAQLFSVLSGLKKPFVLEAAVRHVGEEIRFYAAVPSAVASFVSRQIEGLWKDAQVDAADEFNVFNPQGAGAGVYLKQKFSYALPIRTYAEANIDTFAPLLNGLSKLNEVGEGAMIQIVARPASSSAKKTVSGFINALKKGGKAEDIFERKFPIGFREIGEALSTETKQQEQKVIDEEAVQSLQSKVSKSLLEVNYRVIASAPSVYQAQELLNGIASNFSQFSAPLRNELTAVVPRDMKKFSFEASFREFNDREAVILNTEELASIFHFPSSTSAVPKIEWLRAREASPPTDLAAKGTIIGATSFRGEHKPAYITDEDRRRHVYIVGQTGTGKTTFITSMAAQDIKNGKGVAMIDPHGDLIQNVLGLIPPERVNDVILFDPSDYWRPMGMNMLEYNFERPEEKTFIVNEMQSIFNKLFPPETMGPMFEQYMRNALLLLMEDMPNEPATLMEVPRIFTDTEYRERKLGRITNPAVIDFWEKEVVKVGGEASLSNMTPYITSKFNNFIANDYMRPIIGQPKSTFNFRQLMDDGKILLVNLSKGRIGDINANLLGMVITGKILMAALSRVDLPENKRRDFYLYIDEFQNFTTDSIATILSEARKYRLNLVIAHQFIAQLADKIRDAVFGNVGSVISFRVGVEDTEILKKQFEPVFSENDLISIDNFNAYVRILTNGQTSRPFNIKLVPPLEGNDEFAEKLRELSRAKYGRDRQEVEEEIIRRLRE
ncbi:MAG: type IV secretion system DNA-binding domain-containing protein [Parcubacteria group bacterium]|nr:type IV secretion system DNA-binding domain-containing protein [Parcubacteria group bacterium]